MSHTTRISLGMCLASCSLMLACKGSTDPSEARADAIVLLGRQLTLITGDTTSIGVTMLRGVDVIERTAATGTGPAWSQEPPTHWSTSDSAISTVSQGGVVLARLPGTAWISVSRGDLKDSTSVSVLARQTFADGVVAVTVGGGHTCALDDAGLAWCWGSMWNAATGTGLRKRFGLLVSPAPVTSSERFVEISVGTDHSCARSPTGGILCWGDNRFGQVGTAALFEAVPTPIPLPGAAVDVSAGGDATCALLQDATVRCWGVGFDRSAVYSTNTADRLVSVSVGARHACALAESGDLWCWGDNTNGQLGTGDRQSSTRPVRLATTFRAAQISAGGDYTCALDVLGVPWCWGSGYSGQLGQGEQLVRLAPGQVTTAVRFSQISAGGGHTCALTASGEPYCWGGNLYGALGLGMPQVADPQSRDLVASTPAKAATSERYQHIEAGGGTTCAVALLSGRLDCWGSNTNGQLGIGQISWFGGVRYSIRHAPTPVVQFRQR